MVTLYILVKHSYIIVYKTTSDFIVLVTVSDSGGTTVGYYLTL